MLILTIRTDKPEAEIGLFNNQEQVEYITWPAHRELAETIHIKIKAMLDKNNKELKEVQAIVAYKGPGSFTGLRIGLSIANALADALSIPIMGGNNNEWIKQGISALLNGQNQKIVMPEYGAAPHITKPKH